MPIFIKVTPKGETMTRFVRDTLREFYLSQGAKVEAATDEEVYAAEPAERPAINEVTNQQERKQRKKHKNETNK